MSKEEILGKQLNDEELRSAQGGNSKGNGGCDRNFYKEQCTATVEPDSWCLSDDYCEYLSSKYTPNVEYVEWLS